MNRYCMLRSAIACIGLPWLLAASVCAAQDNAAATADQLDTIEVTGTHIRGVDLETQHSIQILQREDLLRTGLDNISDIVQSLIIASGQTLNRNRNNGTVNDGELRINLRGLGDNRNLVLVNGQRWVTALDGGVDLSTIPLALVERVEVLKDGASAIYGSDAIGGVINIITRRNYNDAEFNVRYGENSHGDGAARSADFTIGHAEEDWSVAAGVEYGRDDPIYSRDRSISAFPAYGLPPNASGDASQVYLPVGYDGYLALIPGRPGTSVDDFRPFDPATDSSFNVKQYTYLQTPQDRRALFAQGRFEISPQLAISADVLLNRRQSAQQLAPGNLLIDAFDLTGPSGFFVDAHNVYNPFGVPVGFVYERLTSLGPRDYAETVDTQRLHLGLDGLLDIGGRDLNWAIDASRVRSSFRSAYGPYALNDELALALGPSFFDAAGVARCGTPGAIIPRCVPLNVFSGGDAITPQMGSYFATTLHDRTTGQTTDLLAHVSGDLADLPAGALQFAAGVERRLEQGSNEPDPLEVAGQANGDTFGEFHGATFGSDSINEAFVEFEVPLLSERTFARQLDFIAASRYSNYSAFGGTTNSQFGMRWKPHDDLLLRANTAQGFRAPSLFDLFRGPDDYEGALSDPCATNNGVPPVPSARAHCDALGVPRNLPPQPLTAVTLGNSPQLRPETSRSYTLGAAYSPAWLAGLNATLDWYDIRVHNAIDQQDPQFFLDDCYLTGDPVSCTHIVRDADGSLAHVTAIELNLPGGLEREGIDLGLDYRLDSTLGRWKVRWDVAYVIYAGEVGQPKPGTVLADGSIAEGNVVGQAVNWRWRSVATLDWANGPWTASITARYFSSLLEDCSNVINVAEVVGDPSLDNLCSRPNRSLFEGYPANHIASVTYFDLAASWETPWRGRVTLGIRNAFDRSPPPTLAGGSNYTFIPDYDVPGRFYYVSYRQRF